MIENSIDTLTLFLNEKSPKIVFLENPSIENCIELASESNIVYPIYTCSIPDVPDWSKIKNESIIQPLYVGEIKISFESFVSQIFKNYQKIN